MAYTVLKELHSKYPNIKIYRVLAYMPKSDDTDIADTILLEGIETVHPRYAIIHRNNWMINRCDYVICYVTHPTGGTYQALERAKKKDKIVILIEY